MEPALFNQECSFVPGTVLNALLARSCLNPLTAPRCDWVVRCHRPTFQKWDPNEGQRAEAHPASGWESQEIKPGLMQREVLHHYPEPLPRGWVNVTGV